MNFKKESLLKLLSFIDDKENSLIVEECGEWIDYGEYQYKKVVFGTFIDGKKRYFMIVDRRKGSYKEGYVYDSSNFTEEMECAEVEEIVVTQSIWKVIKECVK